MGKKKSERTDAERRTRQAERIGRHLQALRCIMGSGRWDAESLARELEVSPRTVHRIMNALAISGVPWYFCKETQSYRVRPGYKFPGLDRTSEPTKEAELPKGKSVLSRSRRLLADGEKLVRSLRELVDTISRGEQTAVDSQTE